MDRTHSDRDDRGLSDNGKDSGAGDDNARKPGVDAPDVFVGIEDDAADTTEAESREAVRLLNSWIAVEVLSPLRVKNLDELTSGREAEMANLSLVMDGALPWESGYPETEFPKGTSGYFCYDVVFGNIDNAKASKRLAEIYGESYSEGREGGTSIIASLRLSPVGTLKEHKDNIVPPLVISSYGWGLVQALNDKIGSLHEWSRKESDIVQAFMEEFEEFTSKPVGAADLQKMYFRLTELLGFDDRFMSRPAQPGDLVGKPVRACGTYVKVKADGTPDPYQDDPPGLITNSFYLSDLIWARKSTINGKLSELARRYIGDGDKPRQVNILENNKALSALLKPDLFPAGKWPAPGRHPLVTLQQAAINYALHPQLKDHSKMVGVNGPPGTGKTTLLKDLAAGLVVSRAIAMSAFDDPRKAFSYADTGSNRFGRSRSRYVRSSFRIDPSITGFEMLVASSNNAAVENVSIEWATASSITEDHNTSYFPQIATRMNDKESWGLISAALGNGSNRARFMNNFWFSKDYGIKAHLAHIQGKTQPIQEKNSNPPRFRQPKCIEAYDTPRNHAEAMRRWHEAIGEFRLMVEKIKVMLAAENSKAGLLDNADHTRLHGSAPWLTKLHHREREDIFEAALKIHRCFVDAAAAEMTSCLSAGIDVLSGRSKNPEINRTGLAALFLMVPVISTTFASVSRMLGSLPENSIGWLVIDEAGQATPQSAVGAMMRCKNAMVVGDPIQVEPVTTISDTVMRKISQTYNIDPDHSMAPAASVQTFADAASNLYAEYPGDVSPRRVGMPLLVHRRCSEPMFSISNKIGYGGLMVNMKKPGHSRIRDALGPSRWINVVDPDPCRWSRKEGEQVIRLLKLIKESGSSFDIYIITPFRAVESGLRRMIVEESDAIGISHSESVALSKRVGTVHKVQGREADTVIMVLGQQGDAYERARLWAGSTPNIPNVAVTRAKEALYVIGNRAEWSGAGYFRTVDQMIDTPMDAVKHAPDDGAMSPVDDVLSIFDLDDETGPEPTLGAA